VEEEAIAEGLDNEEGTDFTGVQNYDESESNQTMDNEQLSEE
jgi:hypothetical protein